MVIIFAKGSPLLKPTRQFEVNAERGLGAGHVADGMLVAIFDAVSNSEAWY